MTSIQYQKPYSEVSIVKKQLGRSNMSNREVGEKTFQYFVDNEVDE